MEYIPYNHIRLNFERKTMKFKVQYYIKSNGEIPVLEFLDKLDKKMSAKMIRNIKLLEDNGNHLSMPYSESLSKGLFQLRAQSAGDISRIIYFFYHDNIIILTNGFIKKTNKTPVKHLLIAKKYKEEYLKYMRNNDENNELSR